MKDEYLTLVSDKVKLIQYNDEKNSYVLINGKPYKLGSLLFKIIKGILNGQPINEIINETGISSTKIQQTFEHTFIPLLTDKKTKQTQNSVKRIFDIVDTKRISWMLKFFKYLFFEKFYLISFIVVLFNVLFFILLGLNYIEIPQKQNNHYFIFIIYATVLFITFFHEIGHVCAAYKFSVPPQKITFGLYLFFPVFFVDLTHIYNDSKKIKIIINLGGVYFQAIANLFFIAIFILSTNNLHTYILLKIITINSIIILFNLNPFFKFDGYWILSDLLNIQNLRKQVKITLNRLIKEKGITKEHLNESRRNIIIIVYLILYYLFILLISAKLIIFIQANISMIMFKIQNAIISSDYSVLIDINFVFKILIIVIVFVFISILFKNMLKKYY